MKRFLVVGGVQGCKELSGTECRIVGRIIINLILWKIAGKKVLYFGCQVSFYLFVVDGFQKELEFFFIFN